MKVKISVIIPVVRLDQIGTVVERLHKSVNGADIEVITVTSEPLELPGTVNVIHDGTPVEKWNYGAAHSDADLFVLGADDVWFRDGWLEASVDALNGIGGHGVVALNDGSPLAGTTATHYVISRSYACSELGGVICPAAYKGWWMDNEVSVRAKRDKMFAYAKGAVIEHRHPVWGTAEDDYWYELGQSWNNEGEQIFNERVERGFPNEWEPVLSMTDPVDGWGSVALTMRMYKGVDPDTVWDWSSLITSGLRGGDTLLRSQTGIPGHLSAQKIVRGFLYTRCDSLLFVDDDMEFGPSSLEVLRANKSNWDYDVVQAFCTHRTFPPHAIVLKELDEQPGLPISLSGRRYGTLASVDDNTVIPVDAVGFAFTLVKRHVLEALVNEFGARHTYDLIHWGPGTTGEDTDFSQRVQKLGFSLAVDTSVKIGHFGKMAYGWDHFQEYVKRSS